MSLWDTFTGALRTSVSLTGKIIGYVIPGVAPVLSAQERRRKEPLEEAIDVVLSERDMPVRASEKTMLSEGTFRDLLSETKTYLADNSEFTDLEIVSAIRQRSYAIRPPPMPLLPLPTWLLVGGVAAFLIAKQRLVVKQR